MTLTNDDRKNIREVVGLVVDEKVEELGLVTKDDIKHLPTKDEFYSMEDKIMKELKEIREEVTVLAHHSRNHGDDIEKLKKIHPKNAHTSAYA